MNFWSPGFFRHQTSTNSFSPPIPLFGFPSFDTHQLKNSSTEVIQKRESDGKLQQTANMMGRNFQQIAAMMGRNFQQIAAMMGRNFQSIPMKKRQLEMMRGGRQKQAAMKERKQFSYQNYKQNLTNIYEDFNIPFPQPSLNQKKQTLIETDIEPISIDHHKNLNPPLTQEIKQSTEVQTNIRQQMDLNQAELRLLKGSIEISISELNQEKETIIKEKEINGGNLYQDEAPSDKDDEDQITVRQSRVSPINRPERRQGMLHQVNRNEENVEENEVSVEISSEMETGVQVYRRFEQPQQTARREDDPFDQELEVLIASQIKKEKEQEEEKRNLTEGTDQQERKEKDAVNKQLQKISNGTTEKKQEGIE